MHALPVPHHAPVCATVLVLYYTFCAHIHRLRTYACIHVCAYTVYVLLKHVFIQFHPQSYPILRTNILTRTRTRTRTRILIPLPPYSTPTCIAVSHHQVQKMLIKKLGLKHVRPFSLYQETEVRRHLNRHERILDVISAWVSLSIEILVFAFR